MMYKAGRIITVLSITFKLSNTRLAMYVTDNALGSLLKHRSLVKQAQDTFVSSDWQITIHFVGFCISWSLPDNPIMIDNKSDASG